MSTWVSGITDVKILNFFHRPVTLSTCIITFDSLLDVSTSWSESFFLPFVKCGIWRVALYAARSSLIKNPRSVKISSFGSSSSKNHDFDVIPLSETWAPQPGDKKEIAPQLTPTKVFNCMVMLLIWPCLCSSNKIIRFINKNLSAVNDTPTLPIFPFKTFWHFGF